MAADSQAHVIPRSASDEELGFCQQQKNLDSSLRLGMTTIPDG